MTKYVLDTNLYVRAFRNAAAAEELAGYYVVFARATYLSAIVLHELLVGTTSAAKRRQVEEEVARPFKRTGRVLTPSFAAWEQAGAAIAQMARQEKRDLRSVPKSLVNDYLLAASCREEGVILITENTHDFEAIRARIAVGFRAPWPG